MTEKELLEQIDSLDALAGSFKPAILKLMLTFNFEGTDSILNLNKHQLGTFIHEYIHFLQSISTPWGVYYNMCRYQKVSLYLGQYFEAKQKGTAFSFNPDNTLVNKLKKVYVGAGKRFFPKPYEQSRIDMNQSISITSSATKINGKDVKYSELEITPEGGPSMKLLVGADLIMESMAALYQELIDPDSVRLHKDMPYNFVRKYCRKNYPNIAEDTRKLICCCYASLFSMCPADELVKVLDYASIHSDYDGYLVFRHFIDDRTITIHKLGGIEENVSVVEFSNDITNRFKTVLEKFLGEDVELDYLDQVLERTKLSTGWIPIITALYDAKPFGISHIQTMVDYLGVPYTEVAASTDASGNPIVTGVNMPTGYQKATVSKDVERLKEIFDLYNGIMEGKIK